jgi:integrase
MPKERTGYVFQDEQKRWFARLTYTDEAGVRRNVKRRAENKTAAKETLKQLIRELEDHGERAIESTQMTFAELADYYEDRYLGPAQYLEGRKVSGQRSYRDSLMHLRVLREQFSRRRLRDLTYGDIEKFKAERLTAMTVQGKQRSLANVHRTLALLRAMLRVAQREGWITRNPFAAGRPLIAVADEKKRERILSREEEERLLAACIGPRAHLRPLIICALDTGMRRGEMFKLTWAAVDFLQRLIFIEAANTKTLRAREVPMTTRLLAALQHLYEQSPRDPDGLVFGIENNVSKSFTAVRRVASLPELRFHDLRHTAATRLVQGHLPIAEVARILGHTTLQMSYRYTNADSRTLQRAAAILDEFHAQEHPTQLPVNELVH